MSARGHHGVRNPKKAKKNPYDKKRKGRGNRPPRDYDEYQEDFNNRRNRDRD